MPDALAGGNIAALLAHAGATFGQRPAIVDGDVVASYAELAARAEAYASRFLELGLAPGARIGIFLPRGAEAVAAFFGAARAGGIAILVNELYQSRQIEHVLAHAGVTVLVVDPGLMAGLVQPLNYDGLQLVPSSVAAGAPAVPVDRAPDDPAQLVYTSGSTGRPKGVVVSHGNLWAGALIVPRYLEVQPEDRIASTLPFGFVYGLNQLMCALVTGARLVIVRATLPEDIAASLKRDRISILASVPPGWLQLLQAPSFASSPIPDLRILTCAGGRLPPEAALAVRRAQPHARLFLMYGLSEVFRSTFLPPEEVDEHPDSMGRAIPRSEVFVVREDLSLCDPGEVGELVHRGPTVTLGYWNDPEATDRVFRPGPLPSLGVPAGERVVFSGDFVRTDEAGRLYYVGRRDHMIKTLGYRISPDEIADVCHGSGQVREVVVLGEPDPTRGQRIVAVVTLRPGGSTRDLKRHCATELPRYMQPARIVVMESLPRGPAGKYDFEGIRRAILPSRG